MLNTNVAVFQPDWASHHAHNWASLGQWKDKHCSSIIRKEIMLKMDELLRETGSNICKHKWPQKSWNQKRFQIRESFKHGCWFWPPALSQQEETIVKGDILNPRQFFYCLFAVSWWTNWTMNPETLVSTSKFTIKLSQGWQTSCNMIFVALSTLACTNLLGLNELILNPTALSVPGHAVKRFLVLSVMREAFVSRYKDIGSWNTLLSSAELLQHDSAPYHSIPFQTSDM